jgi:hypothetical protein
MNAVQNYLRLQPERHREEVIDGWDGDVPEVDAWSPASVAKPRSAEQRL